MFLDRHGLGVSKFWLLMSPLGTLLILFFFMQSQSPHPIYRTRAFLMLYILRRENVDSVTIVFLTECKPVRLKGLLVFLPIYIIKSF